jgi:hypothetical protein
MGHWLTMIGDEDVLDGQDEAVERWERTRFHRKRDVLVVAVMVVAALVGGLLLWQSSDLRATTSETATGPMPSPARPTVFPPSLAEVWRAESSATPEPVTVGPAVVTGDNTDAGGEVTGRDPMTGDVRWRYSRDLPLCTVSSAWQLALAVYAKTDNLLRDDDPRKKGGCSEITALWPETGQRGRPARPDEQRDGPYLGTRNSDAELGTRLLSDGTYVTTTGDNLLTTLRSDLVQTMEYGRVGAIQNPDKQPRNGCEHGTVAVVTGKIAVVERCPTDPGDRVTVYKATGEDNSEKPVVVASSVVGKDAEVVAMSDQCRLDEARPDDVQQCTAVALPNPSRLILLDEKGGQVRSYPLELAAGDLRGDPGDHVVSVNRVTGAVYWYTGSRTIALSMDDLRPLWTVENAMGPGAAFAGKILVPVPDAIQVLNPATGEVVATTPIDRGGYDGEITMSALGPMVFEQRGDTLVALR